MQRPKLKPARKRQNYLRYVVWPAVRSWLLLWSVVVMIGMIPIMSDFLGNRYEVSVQDLVLPVIVVMLVAIIIAFGLYRFTKRNQFGGFVATVVAAFLLTNNYENRLGSIYPILTAVVPLPKLSGAEGRIFSLIFIGLLLVFACMLGKLVSRLLERRNWSSHDLTVAGTIAVAFTFVMLAVPTTRTLINAWPQYFYKPPKLQVSATAPNNKPDIYYIVMEDYANQTQLTNQFGFKNTDFSTFLSDNGYFLNPDAHQNYPYTTMSIASTLNAGYNTDLIDKFSSATSQTIVPYHRAVQYSSVVSELKSLGYSYDEIGSWYETTNHGPLADQFYLPDRRFTFFNHLNYLDDFTEGELSQSPFWRFLEAGVGIGHYTIAHYQGVNQTELTSDALSTLKSLVQDPAGGRFIFAHLIIPHEPFYYNADGSLSTNSGQDNLGEPIKQKYVNQIQYINSQIEPILSEIKKQSNGQAVVILQTDEGPQPMALNDNNFDQDSDSDEINNQDMRQWSDQDLDLKYGAMVAYSIPAASQTDLENGANNVDVFRLVLDRYFGANLSILPECYYAYPNGRGHTFVYDDITARLTGTASNICAANGTGPK